MFARLTRAGFLASLNKFGSLENLRWDACGALQLARDEKEEASQRASIAGLALPPEYAQLVTREEASAHAGVPVAAGGLWFPRAGWIQPRSLVNALLDACGERLIRVFNKSYSFLDEKEPGNPVILATASDSLHPVPHARLRRVRGQITCLREEDLEAPHVVVLRGGMVLPPVEGLCVLGASYDIDDDDPAPRAESDAGNIGRFKKILPLGEINSLNPGHRVGFRVVARDRLPLVGRLGANLHASLAFGSRGLIWASLAAEILASQLEGEPMPLEGKLLDALDPARFAAKARRREGSRGSLPSLP